MIPARKAGAAGVALLLAAAGLGCGAGLAPAPAGAGASEGSTLCFAEPRLEPPSPEIHARVASATAGLAEPERAWIRALMTHESAGVADAVSPTGCAGPLAIQSCAGCTPCCRADPLDRTARWYDRCSREAIAGYLCGPDDPRFDPDFPLDYARRRIAALRERVGTAGNFSFRAALATSWNAGAGVFVGFPSGLRDPVATVERLDLTGVEPYRGWSAEDRWNKLVEVYDYVHWFDALAEHWGAPSEGAPRSPPPPDGIRCFARVGGGFVPAARPAGPGRKLEVRRLRFGRYEPELVELHGGAPSGGAPSGPRSR